MRIILVNYNAGRQLADAVNSIALYHDGLVSSVAIVDNASTDDSLAYVEALENLDFELRVIHNADNRGFAAACNQGAALAKDEFLLFLNPDTRLLKDSLIVPLTFIQQPENTDVGIVGIQLIDENNNISRSCARFPSIWLFVAQTLGVNRLPGFGQFSIHMEDWRHDSTATVDHVIGAFYLIRRSIFDELGGFDERFFVYFEDLDLSMRARKQAWHSIYLAEAQAFHAGGGTSQQVKATRLFYSLRSRLFYGFKHFKHWQAWTLWSLMLVLEPISRVVFCLMRGQLGDVRNTLNAYVMLYRDQLNILKRARQS